MIQRDSAFIFVKYQVDFFHANNANPLNKFQLCIAFQLIGMHNFSPLFLPMKWESSENAFSFFIFFFYLFHKYYAVQLLLPHNHSNIFCGVFVPRLSLSLYLSDVVAIVGLRFSFPLL